MEVFGSETAILALFGIVLLVTGVVAGLSAGLLGVGGGIVIVPILYTLFPFFDVPDDIRMHLAVGTSLATIIPTSIMSARAHHAKGALDFDLLKAWSLPIIIGVIIGGYLGSNASSTVLAGVFGVIALMVSINMAMGRKSLSLGDRLPTGPKRQVIGSAIGGFSVVMGIGGGTLSVPIFSAFQYPIHRAVGTASAIGLIIALPGAISFVVAGFANPLLPTGSLGYVNLIGFALIVPTTMIFAPIGAKIAHAINTRALKLAFAAFLAITAAKMLYAAIGG